MDQSTTDPRQLSFIHTDFNVLMQRRIYRILIICSNYDYFILEEDGRIEEQIFNEYTSLNLRYPPVVLHANTREKAFEILNNDEIDLVILMLNIGQVEPFELAKDIKSSFTKIPIVVLTYFSKEVTVKLQNEDLSAIDRVFCWLGNADLLVAIIKLIEDSLNVEYDVLNVGVQVILLVEDSVRYISQILPALYKIVMWQSRELAREGLNEHQKMLRLRGRPKILLARTYDEAITIYQKYHQQILGILSDVSFKKNTSNQFETLEGIELCRFVRSHDPFLPFILQSSDISNKEIAEQLNVGFIWKQSKNLLNDLRTYIINSFSFGDFIFRDPDTGKEVLRASDLADLQHKILNVPDSVFVFHANRNDFSKWLNARALFSLGRIFRSLNLDDFDNNIQQVKRYIYDAIASYRMSKGRGIIAEYDRKDFDKFVTFCRIGSGSLGGKGRGLAFADTIIKKYNLYNKFENIEISIPKTVVIASDLYDEFIEINNLNEIIQQELSDQEILNHFLSSHLPDHLIVDLESFIEHTKQPIAIRSSSKLEDSQFMPFAGIYNTYMIPNLQQNKEKTLQMLSEAIKCVYASIFYKQSRSFLQTTSNAIDEEKMAIILQEVCGRAYDNIFYPTISGIALSVNYYPIPPEKVNDGVAKIALGLGKHVVEGGASLRFSPRFPANSLQINDSENLIKTSQKHFYALNLDAGAWQASVDDKINLVKLPISAAKNHGSFKWVASYYDIQHQRISEIEEPHLIPVISFSRIIKYRTLPIAEILTLLLDIGQKEMNLPIEIEFAADLDTINGEKPIFYILQIRPLVSHQRIPNITLPSLKADETIAYSSHALGNGIFQNIHYIIYIQPKKFDKSKTHEIALEIEHWNQIMKEKNESYVLIGFGRWGSSDPWLGIPIRWLQISEAKVIVEASAENFIVDMSQGTHLFHNLISLGVGYLNIEPGTADKVNFNLLEQLPAIAEENYIRILKHDKPLQIIINGKTSEGIICI